MKSAIQSGEGLPPEAPLGCSLCPRLAGFRGELATAYPDYFNQPVPSFGDGQTQLLIVGLAPGLKGANRTGRPFTGDYAGDLLYAMIEEFGFARGTYKARPDDGLELTNCMITNAVRCVPPQNKPTGAECRSCRPFLASRIAALPQLRIIMALGKIAHDNVLSALEERRASFPFRHGAQHELNSGYALIDSYHCSRYNTNTGRLTQEMFRDIFKLIEARLTAV